MHVHLPKALHGWRELLKEIGIIVLGVLIALSAEQAVESIHWYQRAANARELLKRETRLHYMSDEERVVVLPCLEGQLDRIEQQVLGAANVMKPLPIIHDQGISYLYRAPHRPWDDSGWRSVIADGISPYLSAGERRALPFLYQGLGTMRENNLAEAAFGGKLMALARPIPLDPQVKAQIVEEIEGERARAEAMALTARQTMSGAAAIGYEPDQRMINAYLQRSGTMRYCKQMRLPIAPPAKMMAPPSYLNL
jgi:hypothetical protein